MHSKFTLYTPHVPSSLNTQINLFGGSSSMHKTMSSGISLEEKFDAIMKGYQTSAFSN